MRPTVDRHAFRKKLRTILELEERASNFSISRKAVTKGAPFAGMSPSTIYNWLRGRAGVPETAALILKFEQKD